MKTKQLSVFIENKTGRINEVTRILGANNINMDAFCVAENSDFGILRMLVSDVDKAMQVLKDAHFGVTVTDVICISCPNTPGSLASILELLAKEGIFIEYMYAFSRGEVANIVIRPTDTEGCLEILKNHNCDMC